jgi:hypothetical protein
MLWLTLIAHLFSSCAPSYRPVLRRAVRKSLKSAILPFIFQGNRMSQPTTPTESHEIDPVDAVLPLIPVVLPIVGAVLMFLLAFIAVSMA